MADADAGIFHLHAGVRPPRELLRRTLSLMTAEGRQPGVAVDLGAGAGPDTLELLRLGWTVHAVDVSAHALEVQQSRVPPDVRPRLHLHVMPLQDFTLPRCGLVWAAWSLHFCPAPRWPALLDRIADALLPGGRFSADFFGPRHGWAHEEDTFTIDATVLQRQLAARFTIEAFDTEDGVRLAGDGLVTRWHAFGVSARKPG